jgi:hypothetical protein
MHEFEFEVRNPGQIQTVKMAVGRHVRLKFYEIVFEYYELALGNGTLHGGQIMAHVLSLKSELAKLTD